MTTLVNHCSGKDDLGRGGPLYSGIVDAGLLLSLAPCVDGYYPPLKRTRVSAPYVFAGEQNSPAFLERKRPCSLESLPDECLFEILRRVPAKQDRILASCVSKRWLLLLTSIRVCQADRPVLPDLNGDPLGSEPVRDVSRCLEGKEASDARIASMAIGTGSELGKLSIRSSTSSACPATSAGLKTVGRCCPSLRALTVWNAPLVGDDGLAEIAEGCQMLEKLDICQCPSVSDKGLAAIAENCPNLASLTIESCSKITDAGLMAVARCCPKLESISISGCPRVGDGGVSSVVSAAVASLRTIKLQNLNISDASVAVIGYYGREVTELALSGLQKVGERGFWVMANANGLRKLSALVITACEGFTDLALQSVAKACPALKQLWLRKCTHISDAGLKSFAVSSGSLESLRLEETDRISLAGLLAALVNCGANLTTLALSRCKGIKDSGAVPVIVPSCLSLRSLTVRNCPGFGSSSMAVVAKMCPKLQHIDLRGLSGVTDCGLLSLVGSGKPRLVKANLSGCPNLTDAIASTIAKIHGSTLETLSLEGCKRITDASLVAIAENCSVLRDLDVSECAVTDGGIAALSSARQLNLQVLSMSCCSKVSTQSLPALGSLGKSLIGLNLQRCHSLSASGVGVLEEKMWWCDILS